MLSDFVHLCFWKLSYSDGCSRQSCIKNFEWFALKITIYFSLSLICLVYLLQPQCPSMLLWILTNIMGIVLFEWKVTWCDQMFNCYSILIHIVIIQWVLKYWVHTGFSKIQGIPIPLLRSCSWKMMMVKWQLWNIICLSERYDQLWYPIKWLMILLLLFPLYRLG